MATELSKLEWVEILQSKEITKQIDLSILQVLYSSNKNAAPASEIGRILGQEGKKPQARINLAVIYRDYCKLLKVSKDYYEIIFYPKEVNDDKIIEEYFLCTPTKMFKLDVRAISNEHEIIKVR